MYINASPATELACNYTWVTVSFAETDVFLLSKTSVVDSDFSFCETYSDPLFTANAYRCHEDQSDIVACSSSGDTRPSPRM